ncbi:hypothetical protein DITRI_Ditri02bG0178100 [Diplodiscus trichospermus]
MYVTRPLSLYRKSPSALEAEPPAEGPYSGYLVIKDEAAEEQDTFCFGACKRKGVEKLPFPQDKLLNVVHSSDVEETMVTRVWFIPVLDQPLSSNRYYVIRAKGRYKGLACTSSREIDTKLCCFFSDVISDEKPKPFDHRNVYQQFKIHRHHRHSFFAKSVATDSIPPKFLRKNGWELRISRSYRLQLNDALGLDSSLRARLPNINFPMYSKKSPSVVVGQWYCPFIFVKEESRPRRQMKKSLFYTMTLEQWWQQIHSCDKDNDEQNIVKFSKSVQREFNSVYGMQAEKDNKISHGGFRWFRTRPRNDRRRASVGLSLAIMEKIRWLQEEGGWYNGEVSEERIEREEEIRSEYGWRRFACYMLVESFNLRRMDGTLVLRHDFRHTHKIQSKWE